MTPRAPFTRPLPRASVLCAALAAALIGPLFFRRWFAREPLTEGFVNEIMRIVVGAYIGRYVVSS
mgnify:CR=1 FL=1